MAEQSTFENELPKKSTVEYVRGLDANGNPILINKSDLASVVGGLIGTATYKKGGLMPKGTKWIETQKDNEKYSRIHIPFTDSGQVCSFILTLSNTNGLGYQVLCHAIKWNRTTLTSNKLSGEVRYSVKYKINADNSVDIYIGTDEFVHFFLSPIGMSVIPTIETVTSVPSDATLL